MGQSLKDAVGVLLGQGSGSEWAKNGLLFCFVFKKKKKVWNKHEFVHS